MFIKKATPSDDIIQKEVILNINEKQDILKLRQPITEKDSIFEFLKQKFKLKQGLYYIISPIINIGELIGIIIVGRSKNVYSKEEENCIFSISSLLASSFLNTRQISKKETTKRHIEALMNISKFLVEKKNLDETLKTIVTMVADVMEYKICSLMLYDEEKQELVIKATQSLSEEYITKPNLKIGQSVSGRAIKEKKTISVIDVLKEPNYRYPEIAKKKG